MTLTNDTTSRARGFAGASAQGRPGRATITGEVMSLNDASQADGSWLLGTVTPRSGPSVTFIGTDLPPCLVGATVRLSGYWEPCPQGGEQLRVTEVVSSLPTDTSAVERYIAANISGCGPARAKRIVQVFGTGCLSRLEEQPELVSSIFPGGTGLALAAAWRQWAAESKRDTKAKELTVRLLTAGVGYGTVRRIMSYFSSAEAAEVATLRHPYRLVDVPGISWKTADSIALSLGASASAAERLEAACRFVLERAMQEGHSGLPLRELVGRAGVLAATSGTAPALVGAARQLVRDRLLLKNGPVLSTPEVSETEWRVADAVSRLLRTRRAVTDTERAIVAPIFSASGLSLRQRIAVWMALSHGTAILTGGPGSGKTTTLKTYLACCRALGWSVQVVAPTGKAASRAAAVTGAPASTVHRLLGGAPGQTPATITARVLVVDETSMCDLETAAWLLSAVDPERTSVLWTGDSDQLPSVGHGQVLADLLTSRLVPTTRLRKVYRQGAGSRIIDNAYRLLAKEPLRLRTTADWRFEEITERESPQRARHRLVAVLRELVAAGIDPATGIQVLAPLRRTMLGVESLNRLLQAELNPGGALGPFVGGGVRARLGDRVVMTRNCYDLPHPLFNGEQGMVVGVDAQQHALTLQVDDRTVTLKGVQCHMLRLAWAITVHRSQGSEYPYAILLYDHRAHAAMLDPGVLYTAITRAKACFTLIGTREAVARTRLGVGRRVRHTGLTSQLRSIA